MKETNIVIPVKSIVFIAVLGICFWLVLLLKNILIIFFLALILALALEPVVLWFNKKLPYALSVLLVVLTFAVGIAGLTSVAVVPFVQQTQVLVTNVPMYITTFMTSLGLGNYVEEVNQSLINQLTQASGNLLNATIGIFSGIIGFLTIIILVMYILLDFKNLRILFIESFSQHSRRKVSLVLRRIEWKLGGWLRGQLLLMFIVGTLTYIGLVLLGVNYALALAVLAGLFEIIPLIGPVISAIPAVLIGFSISPVVGFGVLGLYILVQQLENHLIVPKVMKIMLGLNPLITIIVLLIGAKLLGFVGALLAVPFTIVILEVVKGVYGRDLSHLTKSFWNKDQG